MTNTFKRILYAVPTALTTFYTVPAGKTAVVIGCQVANVDTLNHAPLDLAIKSGATTRYLARSIVIPFEASLNPLSGKLILQPGDELQARTSALNDLELILSVVEFD